MESPARPSGAEFLLLIEIALIFAGRQNHVSPKTPLPGAIREYSGTFCERPKTAHKTTTGPGPGGGKFMFSDSLGAPWVFQVSLTLQPGVPSLNKAGHLGVPGKGDHMRILLKVHEDRAAQ